MNKSVLKGVGRRIVGVSKRKELQRIKMVFLIGLILGFSVLVLCSRELIENTGLLDTGSLISIRDSSLDKGAFLQFIIWQRFFLLVIGVFLWWRGLCKIYLYILTAGVGIIVGACLQICLFRYPLTGAFLWFFLYFPHMIFYASALFCGIILSSGNYKNREEKIKYLRQKELLVLILLGLYMMGIYTEVYWNTFLLQVFLKYF